jgi:hypothetical protein
LKKACPPNGRRSRRVCRTAPRSSCGGMTRPGSGRRTRGPGAGRDAAHGPQRRTTRARPGLHLRGHRPEEGQGRRSRRALLRHKGHGGPVGGDQPSCGAGSARGAAAGPSRLVCLDQAEGARHHHASALAASLSGVEPGRDRLAVRSRQQAVEPDLRLLRGDRRSLPRRSSIMAVRLGTSSSSRLGSSCPPACETGPMRSDQQSDPGSDRQPAALCSPCPKREHRILRSGVSSKTDLRYQGCAARHSAREPAKALL